MKPEYLDTEAAQKSLSVSRSTLNKFCKDLGLPFYRLGRKRLFKRAELDAFMEIRRGAHMSAAIKMPKGKQ